MSTCIRCRQRLATQRALCVPCWALTVHGEPDRLPPFPTFEYLLAKSRLERIGTWVQP